jgi:hypothetical protein
MTKDRYLTIRLPADIEQALRQQAAADTRTLVGQVLHYLQQGLAKEKSKN